MSNEFNAQAQLAGLFASGLPPEEIKERYLGALQQAAGFSAFEDPLYPHIKLFRKADGPLHGYVIKNRGSGKSPDFQITGMCKRDGTTVDYQSRCRFIDYGSRFF